jgi:putative membrane protein
MRGVISRKTVLSALALAVVSIGACARQDNDGTDIGTVRAPDSVMGKRADTSRAGQVGAMDTVRTRTDTGRAGTGTTDPNRTSAAAGTIGVSSGMSDASILGVLEAANRADSASGAVAMTKASNPEVQAYARRMVEDHHDMLHEGQEAAREANITPVAPGDGPIQAMARQGMAQLQSASRGPEFDRLYIDGEVKMHRQVLETARQARQQASAEPVKDHLEDAEPKIAEHLREAEDLQRKLGGQQPG